MLRKRSVTPARPPARRRTDKKSVFRELFTYYYIYINDTPNGILWLCYTSYEPSMVFLGAIEAELCLKNENTNFPYFLRICMQYVNLTITRHNLTTRTNNEQNLSHVHALVKKLCLKNSVFCPIHIPINCSDNNTSSNEFVRWGKNYCINHICIQTTAAIERVSPTLP